VLYRGQRRQSADSGRKTFRQHRSDGRGGWLPSMDGAELVLYRLPEVSESDGVVWVVEGEKDADALAKLGLVATTNVGGAGKWQQSYGDALRGRDVVVLPDNDEPGDKHAALVVRSLAGIAARVGVVKLPGLPGKGDVSDWLAARSIDACINLRHPAAGESSGIAVRMMGIGKPVLLTEGLESAPFPEDACIRIAAGPAERDSLRHHMVLLTSMAEVARTIGLTGAGHIAGHHRVELIGKRFWDLLCESYI
jgi:hypothetical protein